LGHVACEFFKRFKKECKDTLINIVNTTTRIDEE